MAEIGRFLGFVLLCDTDAFVVVGIAGHLEHFYSRVPPSLPASAAYLTLCPIAYVVVVPVGD